MTSPDPIAEIEKRADAATEGPWAKDGSIGVRANNRKIVAHVWCPEHVDADDVANCHFIAHARSDIPYLLQALAASEARVKELERRIQAARTITP